MATASVPGREGGQAVIYFVPEGYSTQRRNLMGRHAAGEGFLRGLARYGSQKQLVCLAASEAHARVFRRAVKASGALAPAKWIPSSRADEIRRVGALWMPDPALAGFAWQRRAFDPRSYSLSGVTHTTATKAVMDHIANLVTAPIEPWDALICTSHAVRSMVETVLGDYEAYLEERLGARAGRRPMLPVIPLGIEPEAFASEPGARAQWRARLGIGEQDVAFLFVGRLSVHAKANPLPMYRALEAIAARGGPRLHLIQAGWFAGSSAESAFRIEAAALAPSVNHIFVDGRRSEARRSIWAGADVFTLLADNIQETFGLAPVEAMAAGLPVVVTDWDGFKDTVRHGVDGFRVPTLTPPPGGGGDLAWRHAAGLDSYDAYIGYTTQFTMVDIPATIEAFSALAASADLRRRMGEAGRRRALDTFHWREIVRQYEELWAEQGAIRAAARAPERRERQTHPVRPDPFHAFASYPTRAVHPNDTVALDPQADMALYQRLRRSTLVAFADPVLPSEALCRALLTPLESGIARRARDLTSRLPADQRQSALRTLVWLGKLGVVRIQPGAPALVRGIAPAAD